MDRNKRYFLDFLAGNGTKNVIFEPFLHRTHAETLIWRRGKHLWDTPEQVVDTLASLTERTRADCYFVDLRIYDDPGKRAVLAAGEAHRSADPDLGFGVICEAADIPLAEKAADVLAVFGRGCSDCCPVIRMDGTPEETTRDGCSGWFAPDRAEEYLERYGGKIRILGGLGVDRIVHGAPVDTYAETQRLAAKWGRQWACGSGGEIPAENYLELISLLGSFGRIR